MISHLQKIFQITLVAITFATPTAGLADDSKLIEWKSGSDPSGKIVDQALFTEPEIRGEAEAIEETGVMKFNGGSMVMGIADREKFRALLTQNDEITIELDVLPFEQHQSGPARIITYSSDHATRNFTVGQDGDQFDLRLQTEGGLDNGILPDSQFGKIEADRQYHLAISYKPGHLAIAVNGEVLVERDDIRGSIKNWTEQTLVFGDELTGGRIWRGEIQGMALYNRAKNLREKPPKKKKDSQANPNKELRETHRLVADLKGKIEELRAEKKQLELRIQAGDQAGADLEDQLADCIERFNETQNFEKELREARSLAKREHERAEKISADILKQVDAQKAIAKELKETIALVQREREGLLAKFNAQPKFDPEEKQRLIADNERLSQGLKEAWENAKGQEKEREAAREAAQKTLEAMELRLVESAEGQMAKRLDELETATKDHAKTKALLEETNTKHSAALAANKQIIKALETGLVAMSEDIKKLTAAKTEAENQAAVHRADALREKIEKKKLENELAKLKAVAAEHAAAAEAEAAAKAAAELKLLDIAPIYFGKNQADSEAQEKSLIAQVKEIHAIWPDAAFTVTGHTCTDGTAAGNLALSQRRAQRIADLIIQNGIPETAIREVIGRGQTEPKADNATQQGREANRRVEVEVLLTTL